MADQSPERERPDIYRFHDYREFLKAWFEYLKGGPKKFSLRSLARESKLASGYLPMVLSGQRKLSEKAWSKMSRHLDLSAQERNYFEILRTVADADSHDVRKEAFDRLQKFRSFQQANPKELEVYRYLTHWYYVAIREMAMNKGFRADPKWIQPRLKGRPTLKEVEQALEFLVENGYMDVNPDKSASLRERDIQCHGGVFRLALTQFHREMLSLASDSLIDTPRDRRTIGGHTMAIPAKYYDVIKKTLDKTLQEVASLEPFSEPSDSVYHIVLAAFPVTQKKETSVS